MADRRGVALKGLVQITLLEDLTLHLKVLQVIRHILKVNGENVILQIFYLLDSDDDEIKLSLKIIVLGLSPELENLTTPVLGQQRLFDDCDEADCLGCFAG